VVFSLFVIVKSAYHYIAVGGSYCNVMTNKLNSDKALNVSKENLVQLYKIFVIDFRK